MLLATFLLLVPVMAAGQEQADRNKSDARAAKTKRTGRPAGIAAGRMLHANCCATTLTEISRGEDL